jgi:hypothetical protein
MGHPGDCTSPNNSTPGNNPTLKIPSPTSCRRVIGDLSPFGDRPPITLLFTHCCIFDSHNIGGVHPTNLKTGNFHQVQLKKQYGSIYYRWWQKELESDAKARGLRTRYYNLELPYDLLAFNKDDRDLFGIVHESFAALQLVSRLKPNMALKFWRNKAGQEID